MPTPRKKIKRKSEHRPQHQYNKGFKRSTTNFEQPE